MTLRMIGMVVPAPDVESIKLVVDPFFTTLEDWLVVDLSLWNIKKNQTTNWFNQMNMNYMDAVW